VSLKSILIFVLLVQHTLINSVAASVHMASETHSVRETPHIHSLGSVVDMFRAQLEHQQQETPEQHNNHSSEHNCHDTLSEVHVHVLCPLAHEFNIECVSTPSRKPLAQYQGYQGLTYKPLLPPPNA